MKLKQLLSGVAVTAMYADPELEIKNIRYDSRQVEPGDLFVAVEGLKSDGHKFIAMAAEKGAAAVLCERKVDVDIPYIMTEDSRLALALVSDEYFGHPSRELQMIGVTGTNGKTTSTYLIKHIIETCLGAKVGLIGTICNMIGDREIHTERTTPESYELQKLLREMVDGGCQYAVMEVSSHALELDRVAGIRFRGGLFTNLTQDHLDFHKTMENYALAKAKLFFLCERGAVNDDDEWAPVMRGHAGGYIMGYGIENQEADLRAMNIRYFADSVRFTAVLGKDFADVRLAIPGRFSVSNALTAIAAGLILDIPLRDCAAALGSAKGVKGRVEVVPVPGDYTMIIDYAHTPDALIKVLQTMRAVSRGRLVALFGCGGDRDPIKRPIMGEAAARYADFTIVTSDNPRTEDPNAIIADILPGIPEGTPHVVIPDRPEAIAWAMDNHQPGDIIVLAGKGHETYQEINGVKHHMDEREIIADHLRASEE